MRYRFFIFKSKHPSLAERILRTCWSNHDFRLDGTDAFLPFDMERTVNLLKRASGEESGLRPVFQFRRLHESKLIGICTEYRKAQDVAEAISLHLDGEGVSLVDAEMDWLEAGSINKSERTEFVVSRLACQRHRNAILRDFRSEAAKAGAYFFLFNLGECHDLIATRRGSCRSTIDVAVSIMKGRPERCVPAFFDILNTTAETHDEVVLGENGCFVVFNPAEQYQLRFVLEGVGKSAQYMYWMEDGVLKREMLHRMSIFQTFKQIRNMAGGEEGYTRSRLYFEEQFATRGEWRNPADRFVDSFNKSLWLRRNHLDLLYGRHPERHIAEFSFYVDDEESRGWDSWKTGSVFHMAEDDAAPLLALIESVIPYYYDYYYEKFHVRKEEVSLILEKLKVVRRQMIENPSDISLGKIAERLLRSSFAWEPGNSMETRQEILSRRRFEIVALFDFFSWWATQLYCTCEDGFYVEGP